MPSVGLALPSWPVNQRAEWLSLLRKILPTVTLYVTDGKRGEG